jgi:DNA-binding response OmpR family regulator
VLLDINLPYFDGYHIARELRQTSRVPIIMISARGTEAEQIRGFDLGADDYVVKPFSMEMLKVKINACLRRVYCEAASQPECLMVGELKLDPKNFMMYYHGKSTELTKNELKIMMVLAENPKEIVKRERLLSELWDDMTFVEDNTLTVNISRIKAKLNQLGLKDAIRTKRGEGYLLCYKEDKNEAT